MQVLSCQPIVHWPSEHWLLFGAPLWGVALSIGIADSAISSEVSPDDANDLNYTRTATYRTQEAPGWWQRLGPYAYHCRTQEAQLKPDCRTEGRRISSRTTSAYSFFYYFFMLYMYGMWQYNVIVPFLGNETKTEWPFPLYETPHPFTKWMIGSKMICHWKNNHKAIHRWIKQWRTIRPLLLLLHALLQLLLCPLLLLLCALYISCRLWKAETTNPSWS